MAIIITIVSTLVLVVTANGLAGQPSVDGRAETGSDPGRLQRISEGFAGRHDGFTSRDLVTLIWGVVLVAGVIALTFIAYHWQRTDAARFGGEYRRMARDLNLSVMQLWLLDRIARQCGMLNAMGLLISRGTFDHWTSRYFDQRADSLWSRFLRERIARLREHLFAEA